jgi:hypothetical protein
MWHPGSTGASVYLRRASPTSRALTDRERRVVARALVRCGVVPEPLAREAVEHTRLVGRAPSLGEIRGPRSLVAYLALVRRADGIALGRHVFLRERLAEADGTWPLSLIAHEVAHVA